MRMVAWLAGLAIFWSGCTLFRSGRPLTDDERALHRLGDKHGDCVGTGFQDRLFQFVRCGNTLADALRRCFEEVRALLP